MLIAAKILDESGVSVFQARAPIDAINLMLVAESKEDVVREKGEEWAAGCDIILRRGVDQRHEDR